MTDFGTCASGIFTGAIFNFLAFWISGSGMAFIRYIRPRRPEDASGSRSTADSVNVKLKPSLRPSLLNSFLLLPSFLLISLLLHPLHQSSRLDVLMYLVTLVKWRLDMDTLCL